MSHRKLGMICGVVALASAIALAAPSAGAKDMPGAPYAGGAMRDLPPAPPPPPPGPLGPPPFADPDMRPEWHGAGYPVILPDARTRDAWLGECHHRMAFYYDRGPGWGWHRHHHHDHGDRGYAMAPAYGYCESYFDDYYRTWQPRFVSYQPPMMMAQSGGTRQVEEVISERYEPLRSRSIPRRRAHRAAHDKRIRVAP